MTNAQRQPIRSASAIEAWSLGILGSLDICRTTDISRMRPERAAFGLRHSALFRHYDLGISHSPRPIHFAPARGQGCPRFQQVVFFTDK
jgi:hypothetical protein